MMRAKSVLASRDTEQNGRGKLEIMLINFFDPASLTLSHEDASYFHIPPWKAAAMVRVQEKVVSSRPAPW